MNTIKITINVPEETDPGVLGEAIASLIKAITPPADWATVAADLKAQCKAQIEPVGWIDGEPIYSEMKAFELGYLPNEIPKEPTESSEERG